jgi:kinesin family protein 6/9
VLLNEEVDPTLVIRRLKQEIRDLREEIRLIKGESEDRGPLTPDEMKRLGEQVCVRLCVYVYVCACVCVKG